MGGGAGGHVPPQFSQKYELVGQFLLKGRAIFLFRFCSLIFLIFFFSFITCSMHKNPLQNTGKGIKGTLFFETFQGSMPRNPLEVSTPSVQVGQIHVCPPTLRGGAHIMCVFIYCSCQLKISMNAISSLGHRSFCNK